jgi:hypothetical protein
MTEYEMLSVAQEYLANGMTDVLNTFTVLGAYLAAGYLAAHRISLMMAWFVTVLFVAFSAMGVFLLYGIGMQLQALMSQMHAEAVAGKVLLWHPIAHTVPNVLASGYVMLFVMVAATAGSVYFFFECRRRNMAAETAPKVEPQAASAA